MNKYTCFFVIVLCTFVNVVAAQTKRVAHFSHSGSEDNLKTALDMGSPDLEASDFGHGPTRIVEDAQLDSLIYINEKYVVMVTSTYCYDKFVYKPETTLWRAGRDTLKYHPLFSLQHDLDSIKRTLVESYNFKNKIKTVKFIGYDNRKPKVKTPIQPPAQNQNQNQNQNQVSLFTSSDGIDNNGRPNLPFSPVFICLGLSLFIASGVAFWLKNKSSNLKNV